MPNEFIHPGDIGRLILEDIEESAQKLPEDQREEFKQACLYSLADWSQNIDLNGERR